MDEGTDIRPSESLLSESTLATGNGLVAQLPPRVTWEALPEASPFWVFPRVDVGDVHCGFNRSVSLLLSPLAACRRKVLYQRAPRNIHRHVILSEIKEAVAALPSVGERC